MAEHDTAEYWRSMYDVALDAWSAEIDLRRKAEAERDALKLAIDGAKKSMLRMRERMLAAEPCAKPEGA